MIGRDFNVVDDPDLDWSLGEKRCVTTLIAPVEEIRGTPKENESIKCLSSICLNYDLIDIWRTRNPDHKLFSWKQKNPLNYPKET